MGKKFPRCNIVGGLTAGVLAILGVIFGLATPGAAQRPLPDVDIVLVAEVKDTDGWLVLHQEVLATGTDSLKSLRATLPARTGGSRFVDVQQPKFSVALVTARGRSALKITIAGKISASEALAVLTPFQEAALDVQSGAVRNELTLVYGLSDVVGHLLELYLGRP